MPETTSHSLLPALLKSRVVIIMRGVRPAEAVEMTETLVSEGISFIEIPLNSPDAMETIRLLAGKFHGSGIHVGAGTVLRAEDVSTLHGIGCEYVISPNTSVPVIRRTKETGMLSMPGFKTPTEAFTAIDAGADCLKIFPAGLPSDIKIMSAVIKLPIFAVGGVSSDNVRDYLKVASGVGIGGSVYKAGMSADALRLAARELLKRIAE